MNLKGVAQALRELADAIEEDDAPAPKAKPKRAVEVEEEPAPKPKPKPKPAPAAEDGDEELDYEKDIRPKITGLSRDHGKECALEVLEQFENASTGEPCTKGTEVSPEDWPRFLKKIAAMRKKMEADD